MIQLCIEHVDSFPDGGQRRAHAPCALIRLKRHPEIALELPPGGGGVDAHPDQIALAQTPGGIAFNLLAKFFYKGRDFAGRVHRLATQARTKTRMQRFDLAWKKLDILPQRFARRTDWTTKYPGRFDAQKENAFV